MNQTFAERRHSRGADILAVHERLESLQDRGIGRLRQQTEQLAVALEQTAQNARDRKCPVPVGDRSEHFRDELLNRGRKEYED